MEFQNEERVNFIETLSTLINDATALVDGFLSELGWTRERLLDDGKELATCPIDRSHTVQPARLEEHVKGCQLRAAGFDKLSAKDLPMSSAFFYKTPSSSVTQVTLDKNQVGSLGITMKRKETENYDENQINKLEKVNFHGDTNCQHELYFRGFPIKISVSLAKVKSTHDVAEPIAFQLPAEYLETMLSVEDRLKLYEYTLEKSKSIKKTQTVTYDELEQEAAEQLRVLEMQDKEDTDRPKSKVEAMAELRDYKRRRQSYRAKTISQSKRPAVEVIRELIDQQMKYLEIISGKRIEDTDTDKEGEQIVDSLSGSTNTGVDTDDPVRDGFQENPKEKFRNYGDRRDSHSHRYGIKNVNEWHRRERSRERYGKRDGWKRDDRERDWRRDGNRERGNHWSREKNRRSRSRERNRDRGINDRMKDMKEDISKEGTKADRGRSDEYDARTGLSADREERRYEKADRSSGEVLGEASGNAEGAFDDLQGSERRGQSLSSNPKLVGESDFEVKENLGDLRTGIKDDNIGAQAEKAANEDENVGGECYRSEIRKKRKKRGRSRSSSGSISGRRSGSIERYKDKKHKNKKKKKNKKRKKDSDDESEGEWVEKPMEY